MTLWQDLRYAARLLIKDRWFTAVAATALALGIGVNATMFTIINAVLIRGLPFKDPERIISVGMVDARSRPELRFSFRVFGGMFAIFAVIALVLSAVGLYAVTAYSVSQRTQEIGVRMALGAQSRQVLWLVLRRALLQLGIGVPLGIAGAFAVGQLMQSVLAQTSGRDPLTIGAIAVLMCVVSLAACFWPARRATRLDPVAALRNE